MNYSGLDFNKPLTKNQIVQILQDNNPKLEEILFSKAREVREEVFDNKIFVYGFVYFSTFCRNNCNFCFYRKDNSIERYRKSKEEILKVVKELANSGINLIDLTSGEDMTYHKEDFETVLEIARIIKEEFDLPIMISPGVIDENILDKFAAIDTDWYALYQETHNKSLFSKLRADQDYDKRLNIKLDARNKGMLIEEGLLVGVGENEEDIAHSLLEMGRIGASQTRVMSFVPQKGSPMENLPSPARNLEMKIIALMRIMYPHTLIPASLDVDGIKGLKDRINAGANVVTSIIPPRSGLMGVAQNTMDVDEGGRTAEEAGQILNSMGLVIAEPEEYKTYINNLKNHQIPVAAGGF